MAVLIDTLRAAELMEAAGFTEKQAKAVIEAFAPASDELVTKADLRELEHKLTTRIYAAQVASILALIAVLSFFGTI